MLWGKHRVTETPGVTGAGEIRRALCYSQSANPHGRECGYFPVRKLNRCRIRVSNSILPAGQQQNLRLTTLLLGFLQSLTSSLRGASEMQRSGFAGGAGSQRGWTVSPLTCRSANPAGPTEMPQEICAPGRQGPLASERHWAGRNELVRCFSHILPQAKCFKSQVSEYVLVTLCLSR